MKSYRKSAELYFQHSIKGRSSPKQISLFLKNKIYINVKVFYESPNNQIFTSFNLAKLNLTRISTSRALSLFIFVPSFHNSMPYTEFLLAMPLHTSCYITRWSVLWPHNFRFNGRSEYRSPTLLSLLLNNGK